MKSKQHIEQEYRDSVDTYKNAIRAWQNVQRVTRKDGSDFSIMSRNFRNATVGKEYDWSKDLTLRVDYPYNHGYTHDTITIGENDTVNDVFRQIENRIDVYHKSLERIYKKQYNIKTVLDEVDTNMKQLFQFCEEKGFSPYEISDYIHNNYLEIARK